LDISWLSVFADVPMARLDAALTFWTGVTGWSAGEPAGQHGEYLPLVPSDGDRYFWLQRVDRQVGGWHLDLHVPDVEAAARAAQAAGAGVLRSGSDLAVLATPAGQPFCLVADDALGARRRPGSATWPAGRSVIDQLCLDIPASSFAAECRFWSDLTGWPLLGNTRDADEFARVAVPERLPVQLLFQRLGADDGGGSRAHADLAADDRGAEVGRHEQLGAELIRRTAGWTTLRDPAGLLYCVTDRTPGSRVR
jgi:predicted enzyme related to lactoylglutathione lyase